MSGISIPGVSSAPGVPPPTSLYPQPPQQGGALSGATQALDLIGSLTRNEMLQRELKARQAVGQTYQGALNPDLTIDPQKFRAGLATNPDAMWLAPETVQKAQELATSQFGQRVNQNALLGQLLGALGPNPTNEDLRNFRATASRILGPQGTPVLEAWWQAINNSPNRAKAIGIARSSATSPAAQGEMVPVVNERGETEYVPKAVANQAQTGRLLQSLSPDQQQSIQQFGADKTKAGGYSQRILPLQEAMKAINDADAISPGIFGPGSESRQNFKAFWQGISPSIARWAGVDPKELADYAKAKKYLIQSIQGRNQQLGGHSDQQLATTVSGNPNVEVTDLALPDLVRTAIASQRAEQAQMQEGFKAGGPQYTTSLSQWPGRNDVRAFALDLMPEKDREKLIKSLTPAEKTRFNNSLRSGYEGGVMDREGAPRYRPPPRTFNSRFNDAASPQ